MSSWHVEDRDLRRWLVHNTALATSVSIEQHLVSCDGCIDRVGALARQDSALDAELEHGWERVRDAVELHLPSWLERGLTMVGLPAHEAQLVAAARAFRGPLLVAVLVVLVFAELAGQFGQARGEFFFLLVAPLLPSAAVAFGYDPDLEPALEQELCTPYSPARLVVLRTIAVLALAIPIAVLLVVLPGPISFLWLLPAGIRGRRSCPVDVDQPATRRRRHQRGVVGDGLVTAYPPARTRRCTAYPSSTCCPSWCRSLCSHGAPVMFAVPTGKEFAMSDTVALHAVGRRYGRTWAVRDVEVELSTGSSGCSARTVPARRRCFSTGPSLAPTTGRVSIFGWDAEVAEQRTGYDAGWGIYCRAWLSSASPRSRSSTT
jgi:hypothetical protein